MRVAIAALALLAPFAGADSFTVHDAGHAECYENAETRDPVAPVLPCWLDATAEWTLLGCDGAGCALRLTSEAHAGALRPGTFHVATTIRWENGGGLCLSAGPVQDPLGCGLVCHLYTLSLTARESCPGSAETVVPVAPGECALFGATSVFWYDDRVGVAGVPFDVLLCRYPDGLPVLRAWPPQDGG